MSENAVIDSYIKRYGKAQDFFHHAAELCYIRIRDALSQSGIRHIGTFRAKQKERLEAKLYQRAKEGHVYGTDEEIECDIIDLAGVRVALYFPGEIPEALRIIRSLYHPDPQDERLFPRGERPSAKKHRYRFAGYSATHLLVSLGADTLNDKSQHYAGTRVEVQVASMFMHAWAEVEHDLVYKPRSPQPWSGRFLAFGARTSFPARSSSTSSRFSGTRAKTFKNRTEQGRGMQSIRGVKRRTVRSHASMFSIFPRCRGTIACRRLSGETFDSDATRGRGNAAGKSFGLRSPRVR
jgi:ppGpp synthetase/RelA/SpoT-type nucleotidyltranferase